MLSASAYQLLHIVGILLVFIALGGLSLHGINGGSRETNRARVLVALTHGVGLLIVLGAGFGLLARGVMRQGGGIPGWVWPKLCIWLVLAALVVVPYRKPGWSRALWFALPLLGAAAAYTVLYKPL
jgi:hypothetical protein